MAEAFLRKCLHYFRLRLPAASKCSSQVSEDSLKENKNKFIKEKKRRIINKLKILQLFINSPIFLNQYGHLPPCWLMWEIISLFPAGAEKWTISYTYLQITHNSPLCKNMSLLNLSNINPDSQLITSITS